MHVSRRVIANYSRLLIGLSLGLSLVPVLFRIGGAEFAGLVGVLGATAGFASIFLDIGQRAILRELAGAWHESSHEGFSATYRACVVVSILLALVSGLAFLGLAEFIPKFLGRFSPEVRDASRTFIRITGVSASLELLLAPVVAMVLVREWMVWDNILAIAHRAPFLLSALIVAGSPEAHDIASSLITYGWWCAALQLIVTGLAASVMLVALPVLRHPFGRVSRDNLKAILSLGAWNTLIGVSGRLQDRIGSVWMTALFGASGAVAFDQVGFRLAN